MSHILRLLAAFLAVAMLSGIAWAEDAVVLSSTAPAYTVGMVVLGTDRVAVPEGANLTLLFQSGDILRLGGPFDGTIHPPSAPGEASSVSRLAELFRAQGMDASVIGGTRSAARGPSVSETDEVLVDPLRSGTYCVRGSTSIWLARPDMDRPTAAIRRKGSSRNVAWPEDAARIEWPSDVPIDDGSQFTIETNGSARSIVVTFRELPADLPNEPARISTGIILGCQEQYDAQLRRVGLSTVPPEIWVTTDHGRQPKYKTGAPVALTVTASVDGFVYCVAEGADGGVTPISPAGAQLRASTALSLPGRRRSGSLTAGPGLHKVRCWLTDRNISAELPSALVGKPVRLPDRLTEDLDGLFSRVGGARIAKSAVTIETE